MTDQEKAAPLVPMASWKEYADTVWAEFTRRSGKPERLMSPAEWEVLREWLYAGVPLCVVLRGMADTKGRGHSLSYFRPGVQEALEYSRQAVPL